MSGCAVATPMIRAARRLIFSEAEREFRHEKERGQYGNYIEHKHASVGGLISVSSLGGSPALTVSGQIVINYTVPGMTSG